MLRKKKDNSDYEIDRELTGKFAIEKNAEYQERIAELEKENKKLKSDLAYERTMLDNVRAEYKSSQNVIKKLKEENEDLKQIIKLYKSYEEGKNKLKEVYIKNTAKFLDKKFPKINGFMEEDTLQELRDLGEI